MGYFTTVRIWEPIQEMGRIRRYEVPLYAALTSHGVGELLGRSSRMTMELEVERVEFDLNLIDLDESINLVRRVLEEAGAPVGSEFRFGPEGEEKIVRFGTKEGMAIYLDGINLPDSVYDSCSLDELAYMISGPLTAVEGEIRNSWVGRSETALYLYGPNAETIFATIEPMLASYPLCQNARVVIRHGNPDLNPRTVLLPRHEGPTGKKAVYWGGKTGMG